MARPRQERMEELERWIVRWYYEKWIHTPLERLQWDVVLTDSLKGNTPVERWTHFEASCFAISLPPSRSEWLAALYEHAERRLSRKTGITVDGLHYKSDEIEVLIKKYGEERPLRVSRASVACKCQVMRVLHGWASFHTPTTQF